MRTLRLGVNENLLWAAASAAQASCQYNEETLRQQHVAEAGKGWNMHDVRAFNLKCESCGKEIEELPFLPLTSSRPVYCRECNAKRPAGKKKGGAKRPKRRRR